MTSHHPRIAMISSGEDEPSSMDTSNSRSIAPGYESIFGARKAQRSVGGTGVGGIGRPVGHSVAERSIDSHQSFSQRSVGMNRQRPEGRPAKPPVHPSSLLGNNSQAPQRGISEFQKKTGMSEGDLQTMWSSFLQQVMENSGEFRDRLRHLESERDQRIEAAHRIFESEKSSLFDRLEDAKNRAYQQHVDQNRAANEMFTRSVTARNPVQQQHHYQHDTDTSVPDQTQSGIPMRTPVPYDPEEELNDDDFLEEY